LPERAIQRFLFASRWLLVPFYFGLVICLLALLAKGAVHVYEIAAHILTATETDVMLGLLGLIDMTLTAALVVIVIFSGYENFVSRVDADAHRNWPAWMARIDFTGLKLKLLSSIVAISAIQLLRAFTNVANTSDRDLWWYVVIHLTFVASGLLLALTDRLSGEEHGADGNH
jgi:uncharacterized protein (TIGR00645 family)